MKIQQTVQFVHEIDGRHYTLNFPIGAPLGECYDVAMVACDEFIKQIKQMNEKKAQEITQLAEAQESK